MDAIKAFGKSLISHIMLNIIGRMNWTGLKYFFTGREYDLRDEDITEIVRAMKSQRLIGLSYRETHFTSYCINTIYFFLSGRLREFSHAWLGPRPFEDSLDLRIIESVAEGVRSAPFWKVLLVDAVALLKPKYFHPDKWAELDIEAEKDVGHIIYDIYGRYMDPSERNCIEQVVFRMLHSDPDCLPGTTALMKKYKQLTPQMIYDSGDFEVILEIRR